jgi:mevalonate kinase
MNGGCILFKKVKPQNEVKALPPGRLGGLFIVNTNQPKNTKELVAKVRLFRESDPQNFEEVIGLIGDTTANIIEQISEDKFDRDAFLDFIAQNQQYLQELGVSTSKIDRVVELTMESDVYSKITGAGGGGCVLCIPRYPRFIERSEALDLWKSLEAEGFTVYADIKMSSRGLMLKQVQFAK